MRFVVMGVLVISVAGCRHTPAPTPPAAAKPRADPSKLVGESPASGESQIAPTTPPAAKPRADQCPEGTKLVGEPPPKSYQQACLKPDRTKHGKATYWHYGTYRHPKWELRKSAEGENKNGKRHGKWTHWYDNGQKKEEGEWKDGGEHGKWTYWHANGQKKEEGEWKDSSEHGNWTSWSTSGKVLGTNQWTMGSGFITSWHDNGQKSYEGEYKDGQEIGKWTCWDEAGKEVTCP